MEQSVCACGPRSVRLVTGVSLAFDLFVEGADRRRIRCSVVDATFGAPIKKSGTFTITRCLSTVYVIVSVWLKLLTAKIYYATMSTSPLGFIRDYLTVGFAKLLGRRTVLHLHGGGFEEFYRDASPWLQRRIVANLKRTDVIVVLGELLKEQFYCAGDFVRPKLRVVPNGLTLGVEEPEAAVKFPPGSGRVELLYLSSLMPSKGFFDVIQAVEILEQQFPGRYHLNLCGHFVDARTETPIDVHDLDSLVSYIARNDLEDSVTYHGQVVGAEKMKQFAQAHLFLLPTSYPWEGQPLSIIEAMAYGLPVVSCRHKGIPEQVIDGETGCFVRPKDPEHLAIVIEQTVRDPNAYSKMSKAATAHYEKNFTREVHLTRLIEAVVPD